jgi:predicted aminopeptidase
MQSRKWWFILAVLIIGFSIYHAGLISYGMMQAKGQLTILFDSRPIEEIRNAPLTPDSLLDRLIYMDSVKAFAGRLGLNVGDNYTSVYDQKGKDILWNVSACRPYAFESYQWTFPVIGSFGYKGFFKLDKAKKLANRLEKEGWDVRIRSVGAWSTLGWFNDPLMSNQLFKPKGSFAETIFHESTHATIFYPDSLVFNENIASFIGKQATLLFLKQQFGDTSSILNAYLQTEEDAMRFRNHILIGKDKLDSLYASFEDTDDTTKRISKEKMIAAIVNNLDTLSFYNSNYRHVFDHVHPNNAFFMGYNRYYSHEPMLRHMLSQHNNDLAGWIQSLKPIVN